MGKSHHKRRYYRLGELLADLQALLKQRRAIGQHSSPTKLDPAFRERLMLAVTAVNECRFCSYVHSRMALRNGLTESEVRGLLDHSLAAAPAAELPAILFAQHWAECGGQVEPDQQRFLVSAYGENTAHAILAAIQTIRVANLLGNTFDEVFTR